MKIVVNGKDLEVADGLSVEGLLTQLGVKRQYTAVAVNREVTPKSAYEATMLREGEVVMGWLWHTRANLLRRDTNRKITFSFDGGLLQPGL